jgi:hypothetical protein
VRCTTPELTDRVHQRAPKSIGVRAALTRLRNRRGDWLAKIWHRIGRLGLFVFRLSIETFRYSFLRK